jgi:Fic family protein
LDAVAERVHRVVTLLEGLARFLLRSEAIASSRIEGLQVSPQQVALFELAAGEGLPTSGLTRNARLVANNITVLRQAASELASAAGVTVEGINSLHRALPPDERLHGLRSMQNWIGGSDWHPLDAEFVPPPPELVPQLMTDLVEYLGGATHAPLLQAALVHAQFETIHPYADGNGSVGRALIHTVLTRRGLTPTAILPISLVLLTRSDDYIRALTSYRHAGEPAERSAGEGLAAWVQLFLDASETAVDQAARFAAELDELQISWRERLAARRAERGVRERPRSGSAVARLVEALPEVPMMTTRSVQRLLDLSFPAARAAVEELADAGIVARKRVDRGTTGYLAIEVSICSPSRSDGWPALVLIRRSHIRSGRCPARPSHSPSGEQTWS